ncbi:NlpC/P60 family protein [Paracoccus sp. (in: a-proteobacteria)]|uniref:NlpC/P60 family protein n=1 Tax=Paracoccus sp. TaxID=267 RepID=UPI0026E0D1A6|nr:NlpC/P60 family protein [Paracoccus sp. (in: a-proteobacteria)]MDO5647991.1 NlpC/P60 family protein [Paracoccus sp. (in: a-proteobacteria)]
MGDRVVALARDWIGTPYVHQASARGAGCDCLGLIRGVWRGLYGADPEPAPDYSPDWGECSGDEVLLRAMTRHFPRVDDGPHRPGQVLLFRMQAGAIAKHLGIVVPGNRFIHAYSGHGVIDSPLTLPWRNRVVARFRFP